MVACVEYHGHRVVGAPGTDLSEQFASWNMVEHAPHWGETWATESVFGAGSGTIPYRYRERYNWDAWCVSP